MTRKLWNIYQRVNEDLSPIFKVYSLDHSVTLKLIKKITNQFIKIKGLNTPEQLESALDILFEDINQVATLEKYFLTKEESLIFPLIAEYIPVHSQPQLIRYSFILRHYMMVVMHATNQFIFG